MQATSTEQYVAPDVISVFDPETLVSKRTPVDPCDLRVGKLYFIFEPNPEGTIQTEPPTFWGLARLVDLNLPQAVGYVKESDDGERYPLSVVGMSWYEVPNESLGSD